MSWNVGSADKMKVIFNGVDTEDIRRTAASSMIGRKDIGIPEDAYILVITDFELNSRIRMNYIN